MTNDTAGGVAAAGTNLAAGGGHASDAHASRHLGHTPEALKSCENVPPASGPRAHILAFIAASESLAAVPSNVTSPQIPHIVTIRNFNIPHPAPNNVWRRAEFLPVPSAIFCYALGVTHCTESLREKSTSINDALLTSTRRVCVRASPHPCAAKICAPIANDRESDPAQDRTRYASRRDRRRRARSSL